MHPQEPMKKRCPWPYADDMLLRKYHDEEWGVPVHDDAKLFEMLVLEGAQAGLNWSTILSRRENYRRAFSGFDPRKVSTFGKDDIRRLLADEGIIRNRLKIESAISNAKVFLDVQDEFGSFDSYIWGLVGGRPKQNKWKRLDQIPAITPAAEAVSRDMRKRGFRFVGPTICYAYMEAMGLVNDHLVDCFRHSEIR
jgi:DNA-3-methyladenine glycosylase I